MTPISERTLPYVQKEGILHGEAMSNLDRPCLVLPLSPLAPNQILSVLTVQLSLQRNQRNWCPGFSHVALRPSVQSVLSCFPQKLPQPLPSHVLHHLGMASRIEDTRVTLPFLLPPLPPSPVSGALVASSRKDGIPSLGEGVKPWWGVH